MIYATLEDCLLDLEKKGELLRIKEEVEPYLEMAAIHLRVHEKNGPALLFENVKGSSYRAASNIFGTDERSKYIFRNTLPQIEKLMALKDDPLLAFKHPLRSSSVLFSALKMRPKKLRHHPSAPFTK